MFLYPFLPGKETKHVEAIWQLELTHIKIVGKEQLNT